MKKYIIFIQGAGDEGYEADAKLVASLQAALGADYNVLYPHLQVDETAPDFDWCRQIGEAIDAMKGEVILVAHSLGASLLLKYLSKDKVTKKITGVFLISTPFWSGDEDWKQGFKLEKGFENNLPEDVSFFLYHSKDDEEVPFAHLAIYAQKLQHATVREIASGGHQLNDDLAVVAEDIISL